jgi:hypothetical protein
MMGDAKTNAGMTTQAWQVEAEHIKAGTCRTAGTPAGVPAFLPPLSACLTLPHTLSLPACVLRL